MSIYAAPGANFEAVALAFDSGLAGTVGVRLRDNQGNDAIARTTAGIAEDIAGSGIYRVTLPAPAAAGQYAIEWDDGSGNFAIDDLVVTYTAPSTVSGGPFATNIDLGVRLGLALTPAEQARADVLLGLATGIIQQKTKQTISLVTDEVYNRKGSYESRIRLPQRPVVSVASVVLDGVTMDPTSYFLSGSELERRNWSSVIQDSSFGLPFAAWGYAWSDLVITYTHGYAVIPELVKATCMEMVVRVWVNPGSVIQEGIAGVQTTYAPYSSPPRGLLLTDEEKSELMDFLGRAHGSINLR